MRAAFGNSIFPDKPCLEICKQQYQNNKINSCLIFRFKMFVLYQKYPSLSIQGVLHGSLGLGKRKDFEALLQASCLLDDLTEFFHRPFSPLFVIIWKVQFHFLCQIKKSRYFPITFKKQFTKKCQLSEWVSLTGILKLGGKRGYYQHRCRKSIKLIGNTTNW